MTGFRAIFPLFKGVAYGPGSSSIVNSYVSAAKALISMRRFPNYVEKSSKGMRSQSGQIFYRSRSIMGYWVNLGR